MGAADSVPGVSGGTVAFITNIYDELINSIKSMNLNALKILFKEGFPAFWKSVNGNFLLTLMLGILSSLLLLSRTVLFLLENFTQHIMSFFMGLILASCWYVASKISLWNATAAFLILLGVALTIALSFVPQSMVEPSLMFIFFSGALAICAMILPGISGAFILLLLGVYQPILNAVGNFDFLTLFIFMVGCATGLIAFSNILSYLLNQYRNITLAFLSGVLAGSLYTLWPWKKPSIFGINNSGESVPIQFSNLWPEDYELLTGEPVDLWICLLLMVIGACLVYFLEKLATVEVQR